MCQFLNWPIKNKTNQSVLKSCILNLVRDWIISSRLEGKKPTGKNRKAVSAVSWNEITRSACSRRDAQQLLPRGVCVWRSHCKQPPRPRLRQAGRRQRPCAPSAPPAGGSTAPGPRSGARCCPQLSGRCRLQIACGRGLRQPHNYQRRSLSACNA